MNICDVCGTENCNGPHGLFAPRYSGDLTDLERHPELQEFVMRQKRALTAFTARQAQDYVQFALNLKQRLEVK